MNPLGCRVAAYCVPQSPLGAIPVLILVVLVLAPAGMTGTRTMGATSLSGAPALAALIPEGGPSARALPGVTYNGTAIVATVPLGNLARSLTFDTKDGYAVIENTGANSVQIVNGATPSDGVIATIPVGSLPFQGAYDPGNGYTYVPNQFSSNVSIVDATSLVATLPAGDQPSCAIYDPVNGYVYVGNLLSNNVTVINGTSVVANLPAGNGPGAGSVNPRTGEVYVVNMLGTTVTVLNGTSVEGTVQVGSQPYAAAYDPASDTVDVTNENSNNVSVIQGTTVIGSAGTGIGPMGLAYDPGDGEVYVANSYDGTLSVINGSVNVGSIHLGTGGPQTVLADPLNGDIYVGGGGSVVYVTNATSLQATVPVGSDPDYLSLDTLNGYVFVVSTNSDNMSVLWTPPQFALTFSESGLPAGTSWSVTFNGSSEQSTTALVTFSGFYVGNYSFSLGTVAGYRGVSSTSSPIYLQADRTVPVVFTATPPPRFAVTFMESGLSGQSWSVDFNGSTNSSTGASIGFVATNGSYLYTVAGPAGFKAAPASGPLTVSGAAFTQTIAFTMVSPPSFTVTFHETGLAHGTHWSVTFNGTPETSSTEWINASAVNGSYPFSIDSVAGYTANRTGGSATVAGTNISVQVGFTPTSSSATSSGFPILWLGAGVAVVLIVVVAAVVLLGRKRPRAPPPQDQAPN
jgi:YVTN family beta-propeller protein